ncbi:MAG: acyl-CoA thioesterase [Rhodocyclaceae bacterium]|jgi:acyl-CoA thioester hydrolase|nr:acyl-CoA thioesterase [Rhodocyclaceae bacterium]MCA3026211.1 acyl-CoA thioesterase [Rhodocyclaceae bacterium]MCA3030835.1 acyl-CoA thioesterase [Rhodocyclaceae bacterium]MCA3036217.1 acyl-CoA thioesterase [Rhodocyclaceae bacterium]MCA3043189.1 acyl-CoA thioesterase [Rhodocyclaceae bacterium]
MTNPIPSLKDFPIHAQDKLRYADTDRQGHVNNSVFATLLETGRVEVIYAKETGLHDPGCSFVIASLQIDFLDEVHWPGVVDIGTRVGKIGRSSVTLEQAIFQQGRCVATSRSVIVHVDTTTRRSAPLSEAAISRLSALMPTASRPAS